jgi:DNA repair exonuclease SbcCD ATPase subunit
VHFAQYVKTAFLNRWNLLVFLGASAFALVSGRPDVVLPLVLACEIGYLGLLSAHPKFQAYVDAQAAKQARQEGVASSEQTLQAIMRSLPPRSLDRFQALRSRCLELRQIASAIKDPARIGAGLLDESQLTGLDRLLWIYLRLLYTQYSLERFLQKADDAQMQRDIAALEQRLKNTQQISDETQRQRFAKAIEDNLQTCKDRLANYQKAKSNYDFIQLEIDRLENKIRSLSELAVNRQEPDFISGQVDQVASSMLQTERTMNDLQFATGLATADQAAPELLRPPPVPVREEA